jgi:hypothetical protein
MKLLESVGGFYLIYREGANPQTSTIELLDPVALG